MGNMPRNIASTLCLGLGLLLAALSAPAQAATITQTHAFSGVPTYFDTATFQKYSGLDPLTAVQVQFVLTMVGGTMQVDNDGAAPATVNAEFGASMTLLSSTVTLPAGMTAGTELTRASDAITFNLAANTGAGDTSGSVDPSAPDGATMIGSSPTATLTGSVAGPFTDYIGVGTFNINTFITQITSIGGVGGVGYAVTPYNTTGFVKVTYTNTAPEASGTPEPGTMVLMGSSLLGAAYWRRRQRKAA